MIFSRTELPWLLGFVAGAVASHMLLVQPADVTGVWAGVATAAAGCLSGFFAERYLKV